MSKYFTQFEDTVIGATEAGWTQLGGATTAHVPAYAAAGVNPVKRRYSALTPGGAGSFELLQYDACNADANRANFDICTLVIGALCTATTVRVAYARGQGSGTVTDYYAVSIVLATGVVSLLKRVASANSTITTGTDATTITPTSAFFVRFRGNGTTLQVRVWLASLGMAGEPTTWLINTTDSSLSAAGWIARGGFGSGLVTALAFFSVGTNGDSAPCPRTNAEALAEIASQQFKPVIIAEMTATGYDSGGAPYTKTINAYVATRGYTSQQQDTPSNKHYRAYISKVPTINRRMGAGLAGEVSVDFGDLEITNVRTAARGPGVLDEWLRAYWKRDYVRLYLGATHWPRHDFRPMLVGRLGMPTAPRVGLIKFPVAGLSDAFNVPIQSSKFTSGEYVDQYKPKLFGVPYMVEPPKTDLTNLIYSVSDGYWANTGETVFDNGVSLTTAAFSVTAVNTGTGEITLSANHGMVNGYRLQWQFGTPPMAMTVGTPYYYVVGTTAGTNKLKLSLTLGGAAITGGAGTTGALCAGFGWRFDNATGELTLAAANAGRIMVQYARYNVDSSLLGMGSIYASVLSALGISANFIDTGSLAALKTIETSDVTGQYGFWYDTRLHLGSEVMQQMAQQSFTWYAISPDGLFQCGKIALPSSTAVTSFTEGDVVAGSLQLVEVIRAVDFSKAECTFEPWYVTGGPLQNSGQLASPFAQQAMQLKTFLSVASYTGAGTPLDNYPNNTDATVGKRFEFATTNNVIAANMRDKLKDLYLKRLGVFEFQTHRRAMFADTGQPLSIGDTISLTHSRLGWKSYGAGTVSPDNSSAFDATKAVVVGIETDLLNTVKLRVVRQLPGYYSTTDLN